MAKIYDIVIVGAGPAGLTASLYAARAGMDALLISKAVPGGQATLTSEIENYPGIKLISGPKLMEEMAGQVRGNNVNISSGNVTAIEKKETFLVRTEDNSHNGLSVILATGADVQKLGVEGEDEFTGKGISYCGVCDAPMFKNKEVAVIGGGDTACYEALHLTKFCSKINIVHRRNRLRATKILQDRLLKDHKVTFHRNSLVKKIYGTKLLEGVELEDIKTKKTSRLKCQGVFIFVGIKPNSEIVKGLVKLDEKGYVLTDENMKTSRDGIYACGDVRKKLLRQISTAVGDGATAAFAAQHYVDELKGIVYK